MIRPQREYITRRSKNPKWQKSIHCGFISIRNVGDYRLDISLWDNWTNHNVLRDIEFEVKGLLVKHGYVIERKQQQLSKFELKDAPKPQPAKSSGKDGGDEK